MRRFLDRVAVTVVGGVIGCSVVWLGFVLLAGGAVLAAAVGVPLVASIGWICYRRDDW